ncbi:MAG: hypothetical protein LBT19_03490 [Candidatus Nomurabacteria bacterium]|jgi:hypothetical protein|nr:hypothetical protein [Candidatus Nomurabacteria bacterium]
MSELDKAVFKIPILEIEVPKEEPKEFVFVATKKKEVNLYDELTAISEEILECRLQKLESY